MTNTVLAQSLTMTSREVAELTGKRHDHVLRDIDNLLKTLSPDLGAGFSVAYEGDPAHGYRYFTLDRDSTYCLVAGYDANARMKIIKRWQALESGEAQPAFQLEPMDAPARRVQPDSKEVAALKLSRLAMQAAKAFGFKGNQAALSADRAIKAVTGQSALALLGQTHLPADPQGRSYTPTDLGKLLSPPVSGRRFNELLEDRGLQTRDQTGNPVPAVSAAGLCEWLDTNKRHSDGTPVKQLRWFPDVLVRLNGSAG